MRALRSRTPIGAIMIDIDQFKQYNDHYGHIVGDVCLRRVGEMLETCFREGVDFVARYGGEEFAVIMPGADLENTYQAAERAREVIAAMNMPHKNAMHGKVTISIGVASVIPTELKKPENLFTLADEALYAAKHAGRNQVKKAAHTEGAPGEKETHDDNDIASQAVEENMKAV
jgi:diguanylate cyclase (GGDEF)-like protein